MKFMLSSANLVRGGWLGVIVSVIGLLLAITPSVADLETNIGLAWMFGIRGPKPAPPQVVIVSIDSESARELGQDERFDQWPRSLHTELVQKLNGYGARVIVFDVYFKAMRDPLIDRAFAAELERAGNVILFARLQQRPVQIPNSSGGIQTQLMHQLLAPAELIGASALSYAPFPVPKVPSRVNQMWLFKSSAGDIPTIPVLALHQYAKPVSDELHRQFRISAPHAMMEISTASIARESKKLCNVIRSVRQMVQADPNLLPDTGWQDSGPELNRLRTILTGLYKGPDSYYIDFYGPPQTINTIPYYRILRAERAGGPNNTEFDFRDKAVFVGRSERYQPDLKDDFYTVFSDDNGIDLSGVEIMATVFANLLEERHIQPPPRTYRMLSIAIWGMLIGILLYRAPVLFAIVTAILLSITYLTITATWFKQNGLWMPLVIPLLIQLPLALFFALFFRYVFARREGQRIQQTAGYFLPPEVFDSRIQWNEHDLVDDGRMVEGVCLISDAQSYTTFAENMEPRELRSCLNQYYALLIQPVQDHGGSILDYAGDSLLAFWENKPGPVDAGIRACLAAMEIQKKIATRQRVNQQTGILPTRIGLHAGQIIIGSVGAGNRFAYRAVGGMINTTSRIEGLNKYLGTKTLASATVANQLEGILTRRVGRFRLKGKQDDIEIFELVGRIEDCSRDFLSLRATFLEGLEQYQNGRWQTAKKIFQSILDRYGEDGPARFYLKLCDEYVQSGPPATWDGTYKLKEK